MDRAARIINRRAFMRGAALATAGAMLPRRSFARMGRGGAIVSSGPAFAPNYNSSSSGTLMTSPWVTDRQWSSSDGGYNAAGTLQNGGASLNNTGTGGTNKDTASWLWYSTDYGHPPIIDYTSAIATAIGASVPAPPDNNPTVMAITYLANERGYSPWKNSPTGNTVASPNRQYFACYVFLPSNFSNNGNSLKWWQVAQSSVQANHLFMLDVIDAGTMYGPGIVLQQGSSGGVNAIYAATNTLSPSVWHCVEWYAQQESALDAGDAVFKGWVDGVLETDQTGFNYFTASGYSLGAGGIVPIYGGGGNQNTVDEHIIIGRVKAAYSNG